MKTMHSPGPWEAYLPGRKFVVSKRNFNHICELNEADRDRDTVVANANLIAAAPDLLTALEACLAYIPGSEVRNWPPGFKLKKEALELGEAAIAKAKGEAIEGQ